MSNRSSVGVESAIGARYPSRFGDLGSARLHDDDPPRCLRVVRPPCLAGAAGPRPRRHARVCRSGDRSTFGYTQVPDGRVETAAYVEWLLDDAAHARAAPFVQRRLDDGVVVGCTRFMNPAWPLGHTDPDEVEIGGTWLSVSAQRTPINSEAKLLLLSHTFDVWNVQRGRDLHRRSQRAEPAGDRTARRHVRGRNAAASTVDPGRRGRHTSRHRDVLDHRRRLAVSRASAGLPRPLTGAQRHLVNRCTRWR